MENVPGQALAGPLATAPAAQDEHDLNKKGNFKVLFDRVKTRFDPIAARTMKNRVVRRSNVDVKQLQETGVLLADETVTPVRVIDENVTKDLPKHLAFLKQSRRQAIFEPQDIRLRSRPDFNVGPIESEFTRVMQYDDWELDYVRWLDGQATHGWDWVRIAYEPDNPGAVAVCHVRQDYLFFDTGVSSIQHSPMVVQAHLANLVVLAEYVADYGFDPEVAKRFEEHLRTKGQGAENESMNYARQPLFMYEVFFKQGGAVYVAWWSHELSEFLKQPELFYNGVDEEIMQAPPAPTVDPMTGQVVGSIEPPTPTWQPAAEKDYPFVPMFAEVTEDATIVEHRGAAVKDFYMQEAATTLLSALIVATQRAANYMLVPDKGADVGVAPKQLSLKIQNGAMWNQKVSFINTPWPDATMFKALDVLWSRNAEASKDIAWAVNNRDDSRKTAAEVQAAQQQSSQLNSTQVLYFSIALREVYRRAWRIVQSQALQGNIQFLLRADGTNDAEMIKHDYRLRTAGDIDYVARQERIAAMRIDWPVLQTTGAAIPFLGEYLKLQYPDIADNLIMAIQQGSPMQQAAQLVQGLASALQAAVMDGGQLKPEFASDAETLMTLQQQTQQFLENANNPNAGAGGVGGAPAQPNSSAGGEQPDAGSGAA